MVGAETQPGTPPPVVSQGGAPAGAAAGVPAGGGRTPAQILGVLERVLAEQQTLVLRLESIADAPGDAAARERADLREHLAHHATTIDRLFAELGALEPPDGMPPT